MILKEHTRKICLLGIERTPWTIIDLVPRKTGEHVCSVVHITRILHGRGRVGIAYVCRCKQEIRMLLFSVNKCEDNTHSLQL